MIWDYRKYSNTMLEYSQQCCYRAFAVLTLTLYYKSMNILLYFTRYFSLCLCCRLPLCIPLAYFNKIHNCAPTKANAVKLAWLVLFVYFRLALGISLNFQFGGEWILLLKNYSCNTKLVTLYSSSVFFTCLAVFEKSLNPSNWENKSKNILTSERCCAMVLNDQK